MGGVAKGERSVSGAEAWERPRRSGQGPEDGPLAWEAGPGGGTSAGVVGPGGGS